MFLLSTIVVSVVHRVNVGAVRFMHINVIKDLEHSGNTPRNYEGGELWEHFQTSTFRMMQILHIS